MQSNHFPKKVVSSAYPPHLKNTSNSHWSNESANVVVGPFASHSEYKPNHHSMNQNNLAGHTFSYNPPPQQIPVFNQPYDSQVQPNTVEQKAFNKFIPYDMNQNNKSISYNSLAKAPSEFSSTQGFEKQFEPSQFSKTYPECFPMGTLNEPSNFGQQANDPVEEEPPLLEELGIYPDQIFKRMQSALLFYKIDEDLLLDVDTCGPLFIIACLGGCLFLAGKLHFTYIYGMSVTGCLSVYILLNLMSQKRSLDVHKTISILGYGLIPVVFLAAISIFFSLKNTYGLILSGITAIWCTAIASRFFETALDMHNQRYLIAYPVLLLYGLFVLITAF